MDRSAFKICIIGCGGMSTWGHGPALQRYIAQNPGAELTACCDLDEEKAACYQKQFGFKKYYTDMSTMLDSEIPDAVCLVVPVRLTAPLAMEIMQKGYPLILEKPPGMNRDETLKMIDIAQKYNSYNQVAFNRRYMPLITKLKQCMQDTVKPHEMQNIQCNFYRVDRNDLDFSTTAIHGIDTVKFIAGSSYKKVKFEYQDFNNLGLKGTNIYMYCEFESGATAQLSFCPVSGLVMERIAVNCLHNTYFVDLPVWDSIDSPGLLLHTTANNIVDKVTGDSLVDCEDMFITNGFYDENATFFNNLRSGRKSAGDIMSGLQSVEIADCIRKRESEYVAG